VLLSELPDFMAANLLIYLLFGSPQPFLGLSESEPNPLEETQRGGYA
jgi:hypothetical protein